MSCVGGVTPATDNFSARHRFVRGPWANPKTRSHGKEKKKKTETGRGGEEIEGVCNGFTPDS